jgi:hypothetical protein
MLPLGHARVRMKLIVLNNDTLCCEDCYEPQEPYETDPGLIPYGLVDHGECASCGAKGGPSAQVQAAPTVQG